MFSFGSALYQRVSCPMSAVSRSIPSLIRSFSNQLALSTHKIAVAHHRNIRISPKKLNDIVRIVRGLSAQEAIIQMRLNEKRKSIFVQKCIENAVNNAVNNFGMKKDRLVVKEAVIGKGVYTRMIQIHGRGRTGELIRRRSHLTIKVGEQPYSEHEHKIGKYGPTIKKVSMRNTRMQQQRQQQQQQQQQQ